MQGIPLTSGNTLYLSPRLEPLTGFVLEKLRKQGITEVVPLMEYDELLMYYGFDPLPVYQKNNITVTHFPIQDFDVPGDMEAFAGLIEHIAESLKRHSVLVHCLGGIGRTGTVASAFLVRIGYTPEKAIDLVRKIRPGSIQNRFQEKFVFDYERYLRNKGISEIEELNATNIP